MDPQSQGFADPDISQDSVACFSSGFRIHLIRIRIKHFRLNIDPADPIRTQGFYDQKLKNIFYSWKKKLNFFGIKNYNLPIPRQASIEDVQVPRKPSALKREHLALQNMQFLNFFLLLWLTFALLDPDPGFWKVSGSTDLIEYGSSPDTKPCFLVTVIFYGLYNTIFDVTW